jgi:hypothetical protein
MKIYLAGQPEEHARFNSYASELRCDGFNVVSTWHVDSAVSDLVEKFRMAQDSQARFLCKFMKIVTSQNAELVDPITDEDRVAVAGGFSVYDFEDAFQHFGREVKQADVVIADLNGAAMKAGYARALGKQLLAIGNWKSPLVTYGIDEIKLASDWGHARAILENLRAAGSFRGSRRLAGQV